MSSLLVELHRGGVYWGDCSLANTLLLRDGQALQAHLVDAETSEIHASLSDGQRRMDVDIAVENLAGDMLDIAATSGRSLDEADDEMAAALSLRDRYERLWAEIHAAELIGPGERFRVDARLRRLNALGFVVEEVIVEPERPRRVRRRACGSRSGRAASTPRGCCDLTGLEAGEGQATVLLNDLASWAGLLGGRRELRAGLTRRAAGRSRSQRAARRWLMEVFEPTVERLRGELGPDVDPVQAYCDYIEVKWLLSEQAGHDVGDDSAIRRHRGAGRPGRRGRGHGRGRGVAVAVRAAVRGSVAPPDEAPTGEPAAPAVESGRARAPVRAGRPG